MIAGDGPRRVLGRHEANVHPDSSPYPPGYLPQHRADVVNPMGNHPSNPACKHAQFMRDCRNTTVPECPNARVSGSLYCVHHMVHPAPTGSSHRFGRRRKR